MITRWVTALPGTARLRKFLRDKVFANHLRRRRFVRTYNLNYWRGDESRSGRGSSLTQTAAIRAAIPLLCEEFEIGSLLDIPCGDFHWMRLVDLGTVSYTGADIVPKVIAENNVRYGNERYRFTVIDVVSEEPERADLIMCRDLLVHLPYRDIFRALNNMRRSGSTWLLVTTFTSRSENRDLGTDDWRPLNFEQPPFNFPPPVRLVDEQCTEEIGVYRDKSLGLWRIAELPLQDWGRS